MLDARHLNSNTDQSAESSPPEFLATELARANKRYKSAIGLMYAYAKASLDKKTNTLIGRSFGDKFLPSIGSLLTSKVFQTF